MILAEYANHETTAWLAQIISLGFIVFIGWNVAYGVKNPDSVKPITVSDNYDMGYVRSTPQYTVKVEPEDELKKLERQVKMAKLRKQLAELEEPSVDNSLLRDCVDTLVTLGNTQSEAQKAAKQILQTSNVTTVQEFLKEYGKR